MIRIKHLLVAVLLLVAASLSANANENTEFVREKGVIARIGAGAPANFNVGLGYRFCPHFELAAEVFSYSGLTTITGVLDARYHILDRPLTPFVAAKAGYGVLGTTLEYQNYSNLLGVLTAGMSWKGFDLGAGLVYDPFHRFGFTANLSWTYRFGR